MTREGLLRRIERMESGFCPMEVWNSLQEARACLWEGLNHRALLYTEGAEIARQETIRRNFIMREGRFPTVPEFSAEVESYRSR